MTYAELLEARAHAERELLGVASASTEARLIEAGHIIHNNEYHDDETEA